MLPPATTPSASSSFNLRVAGTNTQTIGAPGKVYDVAYMQFFQADQLRGFGLYTQHIHTARRAARAGPAPA